MVQNPDLSRGMVLPDRIELSTSPLPMECSTTELRQRARYENRPKRAPTRRPDPCHKAPIGASARPAPRPSKELRSAPNAVPAALFRQSADPSRHSGQAAAHSNGFTMKDEKHKGVGQTGTPVKDPEKEPGKDLSKEAKQDRLKRALRENLKRRKSQARGRGDLASAPSPGDEALPYDESGKKQSE
jgi:hypothetical protein